MIKYLFISMLGVVILSSDWIKYTSNDGLLEFETPVTMNYGTDIALTSIGDIELKVYKSSEKDSFDTKYSLTYYELPVYLNMESDSMFIEMSEGTVETMLEYPNSNLDYSTHTPYQNGFKRTFRISYGKYYVSKSVIYTNGTHFVTAQTFSPTLHSLNNNIEYFFDQVKLHSLLNLDLD